MTAVPPLNLIFYDLQTVQFQPLKGNDGRAASH